MDAAKIAELFAPWRKQHARRAWKPVLGTNANARSHFGGDPILADGEQWPMCGACGAAMLLFLQLDVATLPEGHPVRGSGLLQLFCCADGIDCETWSAFSKGHLVRLQASSGSRVMCPAIDPQLTQSFPCRSIDAWEPVVDMPNPQEHEALGIAYERDFNAKTVVATCAAINVAVGPLSQDLGIQYAIGESASYDKLGGWPSWIQGVEYPSCKICQQRMELVLQLDSEDSVPHMFGDMGRGHTTQCLAHPEVLAFAWAC